MKKQHFLRINFAAARVVMKNVNINCRLMSAPTLSHGMRRDETIINLMQFVEGSKLNVAAKENQALRRLTFQLNFYESSSLS